MYGPRNLSNGSTEFQSTNQKKAAAELWVYDNARTGDIYKVEARVATQESRAITVQATTDSSGWLPSGRHQVVGQAG